MRELPLTIPAGFAVDAMTFSLDQKELVLWLISGVAPYPAQLLKFDVESNQQISESGVDSWISGLPANTQWGWYQSAINRVGNFVLTADLDGRAVKVWRY